MKKNPYLVLLAVALLSGALVIVGRYVFSVGFLVDDVDAAEAKGKELGLKVQQKGRHEDGWGFTYFDTADTLGINLTVRQNPYSER